FSPEDANRDSRVDLEDAIRQVRDFARTAYEPEDFTSSVEKTVSTLRIVAGLKTNLKADNDSKSRPIQLSLDSPYIPSLVNHSFQLETFSQIMERSFLYQSIVITPDTRPPKLVHG
ncbi:MAG: hypothetical protein ABIJ42_10660, partial [Acidobacteriota bacterium]